MDNNYFEIKRAGINTTFQDKGRNNLYHIGIPFSGAMDNRNFLLANKLVGNKVDSPVIEFAYQGPLLKFNGDKITITVTGDVIFKLNKKNNEIEGRCYETYQLENGDEINILSTNKSVYGYLAISGEIDLKFQWGSCSINTKANIGSNDGKKLTNEQKINIRKINSNQNTVNAMDALGTGTVVGLKLAVNVGAMLIGFIALISVMDVVLNWLDSIIDGTILNASTVII